jgi:hypothetical protein
MKLDDDADDSEDDECDDGGGLVPTRMGTPSVDVLSIVLSASLSSSDEEEPATLVGGGWHIKMMHVEDEGSATASEADTNWSDEASVS